MKHAYIKFNTHEDSVLGFNELITHSQCTCLSNEVYCIPWSSLALLDARKIQYSFATEEALTDAQPIWQIAETKSR